MKDCINRHVRVQQCSTDTLPVGTLNQWLSWCPGVGNITVYQQRLCVFLWSPQPPPNCDSFSHNRLFPHIKDDSLSKCKEIIVSHGNIKGTCEGGRDMMANKSTGSYSLWCQQAVEEEEEAYQGFDFPNCLPLENGATSEG